MAELYKRTEKERKAADDWLNKYRISFDRASVNIEKFHERKLLTWQTILFVFLAAGLVNLLTSAFYDWLTTTPLSFGRLYVNFGIIALSLIGLLLIFLVLRHYLSKYKPSRPFISLSIKPEEIEPFLQSSVFSQIMDYLAQGKLNDFKLFADNFFSSFNNLFVFMFTDKVDKKPITEREEFEEPFNLKEFPVVIKEFDVSPLSRTGVNITLRVVLAPHVVYGDKTASYGFYLIYNFIINNPEHPDAHKFIEQYYYRRASEIIVQSSYCIQFAFRKMPDFISEEEKTFRAKLNEQRT